MPHLCSATPLKENGVSQSKDRLGIDEAREAKVELAISNAFAFGGLNAVLVLQKV